MHYYQLILFLIFFSSLFSFFLGSSCVLPQNHPRTRRETKTSRSSQMWFSNKCYQVNNDDDKNPRNNGRKQRFLFPFECVLAVIVQEFSFADFFFCSLHFFMFFSETRKFSPAQSCDKYICLFSPPLSSSSYDLEVDDVSSRIVKRSARPQFENFREE